jgi:predicted ATPase/class 3 adenylate cyclase
MSELPTGTVTFMFTDIEGSTRLLDELGTTRYREIQQEHADIVRRAIALGEGTEVREEGDSLFVAFGNAVGAVTAAVAAQRGLASDQWPDRPVRVRIGLHTGEGILGGGDYVGMDVNRAARIAASAHGGQILLSDATRSLVEHSLPKEVRLRDLGDHRLKDISHPEHLHDLVISGLPDDFPPPNSLGLRPNNLPIQLTTFVGREVEIKEAHNLLSANRLLTITGPGGAGKTRLALQIGAEVLAEFAGGVTFVDLSSLTDPELVPSAINVALGSSDTGGRPLVDVIEDRLREKELLLILDNYEQVMPAAPLVEKLLSTAPRLKVIVTSRIPLSVRGEQEYPIPPMRLPATEEAADLSLFCRLEAVQLFTERARAVRPSFEVTAANAPAVAEITTRLDGLPLAIELAATRTKLLTPEQMLDHLDQGLAALSSKSPAVPERQRSVRDAIAWSYDLLSEAERRLFARLSVFDGGWTLEAAETVCDPMDFGLDPLEGIGYLVDHSLVARTETADGESRFSMLTTIRVFADEKLRAEGETETMRHRHAQHYLAFASEAEPHLTRIELRHWLDRCERENANLRAALRWAIDTGEATDVQLAAAALWRFWQFRGHLAEGRRWSEEILAMPSGQARSAQRSKALAAAGGIAWWQADMDAARAFYGEALAIEQELGNPAGLAEALFNRSHVLVSDGEVESGARMLDESLQLFRQMEDDVGVARVLSVRTGWKAWQGDWPGFIAEAEQHVATWRRLGDVFQLGDTLTMLATGYAKVGRHAEARRAALEVLQMSIDAGMNLGAALAVLVLGFLATWEGRDEDALRMAGASQSLMKEIGGGPPLDFLSALIGDPLAEARTRLSNDVANRAWEEGARMSIAEAVDLARGSSGESSSVEEAAIAGSGSREGEL